MKRLSAVRHLEETSPNDISRYRLRVEPHATEEYALLDVPAHVTYLTAPNGRAAAFESRAPRREPSLLFEPVRVGSRRRLLLLTPNSVGLRINGFPAPRVALLRVGDELTLDATTSLRVGEYRCLSLARPSGDVVGQLCGGCRTPVAAEMFAYLCDCGVLLHCERPPKPDRLECALLASECPSCRDKLPSPEGELRWGESC